MSDVDDLARQFQEVRDRASMLVAPLSHAQFNWRPGPNQWSVAECFEHLIVTTGAVATRMREAINRGRERGLTGSGPFRYGRFSRWFEGQMEPPPRRRMKTPRVFAITTGSSHEKSRVMHDLDAAGATWQELLERARGLDLQRVKTVSPAASLLRFPLGAYFRISTAHERRHLWQAEQVLHAAGFPRG
ncbi:MAG: DinB family protein [Gemmatimonadaceae bacterium]